MIKVEAEKGTIEKFEVQGTILNITADVLVIIRMIYSELYKDENDGAVVADMFKSAIQSFVANDTRVFKPLDDDDSDESQQ